MFVLLFLILVSSLLSQELTLQKVLKDALENNLELKAYAHELKAYRYKSIASEKAVYPVLTFKENFTRTNIPAYVLFAKMNQGRITAKDFSPNTLANPSAVNNFETLISLEIPLWEGGKIRALKSVAFHSEKAFTKTFLRKREEIVFKVYKAYLKTDFAQKNLKLAKINLKAAEEHYRIAKALYKAGKILLSDLLKTEVALNKAQENVKKAEREFYLATKTLSFIVGKNYSKVKLKSIDSCPSIKLETLREKALTNRKDLLALRDQIKVIEANSRATLAETLPAVGFFASYTLYSRNSPFNSEGDGYTVGLSVSLSLNTGLSILEKLKTYAERKKALLFKEKLLKRKILLELDRAYTNYLNSLEEINSARIRVKSAQELLSIVRKRYREGLARTADLTEAELNLEQALLDYASALYKCNLSYGKILFKAGVIAEVLP